SARQFAIGDVNEVNFDRVTLGVHAAESSKINVSSPAIHDKAGRFAWATDLSQITIGGKIEIADGLTFDIAFIASTFGSIVSVFATIEGGRRTSGASYQCVRSVIQKDIELPGGDVPYLETDECDLFGPTARNANYKTNMDRLLDLQAQLDGLRIALQDQL